jgi:hydrogenase maturation protease
MTVRLSNRPAIDTAPNVAVGLGNDIAGDDGAGIEVARILGGDLAEHSEIDVVALPWAGFALLDVLRGRKRAAIVDCLTTGAYPPGTIVRMDESDLAGSVRLISFHDISYPTVMALGRRMGWAMPETIAIWGIEASSMGTFTEQLSPVVAAATRRVAAEVMAFLAALPAGAPQPPRSALLRVPPQEGRKDHPDLDGPRIPARE